MFSSDRHALGERQRPGEAPDLEADRLLFFLKPVMEIDAERALLGEAFDDANIARRDRRCISLMESPPRKASR